MSDAIVALGLAYVIAGLLWALISAHSTYALRDGCGQTRVWVEVGGNFGSRSRGFLVWLECGQAQMFLRGSIFFGDWHAHSQKRLYTGGT
jgi:hypothetical protein